MLDQLGILAQQDRARSRKRIVLVRGALLPVERNLDPEDTALVLDALDTDAAAHQLHQLLGDRRTETGSAVTASRAGVLLCKALENPFQCLRPDATAGIPNLDAHHGLAG